MTSTKVEGGDCINVARVTCPVARVKWHRREPFGVHTLGKLFPSKLSNSCRKMQNLEFPAMKVRMWDGVCGCCGLVLFCKRACYLHFGDFPKELKLLIHYLIFI